MNCPNHPQHKISVICIAHHQCQRKLCSECQYKHGGDLKEFLPLKVFLDKLQTKAQEFKLQTEEFKEQFPQKSIIKETKIFLKKKWKELKKSFNWINDNIENQDSIYFQLMNNQLLPQEYSYQDLETIVKILQGNKLIEWNKLKTHYFNQLQQANSWLKQETEKFTHTIDQKLQGILSSRKIQECVGLIQVDKSLTKTNFQIKNTQLNEIQYIWNGEILKTFIIYDLLSQPQIITNLEEIKNLHWKGELGQNFQKVGLWTAEWKNTKQIVCRGQYNKIKQQ